MANKPITPQKESNDTIIQIQTNKKTKLFTTFKENTNLITAPTSAISLNLNSIVKPIFKTTIENKNEAKSKFRRDHSTNRIITFLISFFIKNINSYIKENNLNNIGELKILDGTQGKEHKNKLILKLLRKTIAQFLSANISKKSGTNLPEKHNENVIKSILELKNNDLSNLMNQKLIKLIHHFSWEGKEKKKIQGTFYYKLKEKFDKEFEKKFGEDTKYKIHLQNHMKYIEVYYLNRVMNQIQKRIWIRNKKLSKFIKNNKKNNNNMDKCKSNQNQLDSNSYNNCNYFSYNNVDNMNITLEQKEKHSTESDKPSLLSDYNDFI